MGYLPLTDIDHASYNIEFSVYPTPKKRCPTFQGKNYKLLDFKDRVAKTSYWGT